MPLIPLTYSHVETKVNLLPFCTTLNRLKTPFEQKMTLIFIGLRKVGSLDAPPIFS